MNHTLFKLSTPGMLHPVCYSLSTLSISGIIIVIKNTFCQHDTFRLFSKGNSSGSGMEIFGGELKSRLKLSISLPPSELEGRTSYFMLMSRQKKLSGQAFSSIPPCVEIANICMYIPR